MPVYCIRSTDAGAPTLNGTAGSLITVINFALNLGVGDRGWTRQFVGVNKMVISSGTGANPYWYRIDDSAAQWAIWLGYDQSMTSIDAGNNAWGTGRNGRHWVKSTTANTTARPWAVIFDERAIYFCNGCSNDNYWMINFLGDTVSPRQTDSFICGNSLGANTGAVRAFFFDSNALCVARSRDGSVVNSPLFSSTHSASGSSNWSSIRPLANGYILLQSYPMLNSLFEWRGHMPGIWLCDQDYAFPLGLSTLTLPNGHSGIAIQSYAAAPASANRIPFLVFDIEGPWR